MKRQSVLTHAITDQYSSVDAWLYDNLFADAVLEMVGRELELFCAALPLGARIVDVGCGGGQMPLAILAQRPDVHITGIDLCPPQIDQAKKRTESFRDRTRFEVGSALELPFADASFDAALSVTSIKHWPSPRRGYEECLRVVKPGGALFLAEVDRGARLDTVRKLISNSRVPRLLRGLALPFLRTFIIGQGLDLDDFRELLGAVPLLDGRVARIPGRPGIELTGRRELAAAESRL